MEEGTAGGGQVDDVAGEPQDVDADVRALLDDPDEPGTVDPRVVNDDDDVGDDGLVSLVVTDVL